MTIVRWNPDREIRPTAGASMMAPFLDTFFRTPGWTSPWLGWNRSPFETTAWEPAVDVYETAEDVIVHAELPGMRREDIELHVENGLLTLRGQRLADNETAPEHYHRFERRYGRFTRTFALPVPVDYDKTEARYVDGVLTVRLPKAESARARRIEIPA